MNRDSYAIPIAIVIAAALIAGAIFLNGSGRTDPIAAPTDPDTAADTSAQSVKPVSDADHIRGNPNATIVIVEYSDFECPYCNQYHETMRRVIDDYGPGGQVAWVFRHFPIAQLHPNASKIAEASECVAELGGNAAFWKFSDTIFSSKTVREFTDMTKLSSYAAQSGVADIPAFDKCLAEGRYAQKVADSVQEAVRAGAKGTPYPVVVAGNQSLPLPGAVPYESMKQMLDNLILQANGGSAAN